MSEFQAMSGSNPVKLTIRDYELLQASGALDRYARVELVEGVIVEVNSEWSRHAKAKNEISYRLRDALRAMDATLIALCDVTIRLSDHSLPEPDGIVSSPFAGSAEYIPGDLVKLAIEVADTNRAGALGYKYELYGDYALPEYWIVDLRDERIHVFWEPKAHGYRRQETIALGDRLDSRTIPGLSIETASLY
ncbi:Uma2 family endonuclease [Sphingomonas sp.]|uniref:Uma2 family endonuclease n=1 Tax=Sphingomonas sp. TaxID=28214 RepID=UPI002DBE9C0E|nr:Uma2 family endonuclease [Sphingomonas sp.]HEU4968582.1 Uma2 family endonuclease [Sphingomonas sp.]